MVSLSPIRFCYQVFILNNPTFLISSQCKYCQILLHSAARAQFPHQTMSKQSTVFESWASDIEGPFRSRHFFSSTFSSSIFLCQIRFLPFLWLLYVHISVLAHFSLQNLNQPSSTSLLLEKCSQAFAKRLTSSTKSSFLCLRAIDSFCFPLMTPTALDPCVGQEVLRAHLYFC